jgi:hypothetical protein
MIPINPWGESAMVDPQPDRGRQMVAGGASLFRRGGKNSSKWQGF